MDFYFTSLCNRVITNPVQNFVGGLCVGYIT